MSGPTDGGTSNRPLPPTPSIRQLVRIVAALPQHQFIPLNHAFVRAKDCLGAGGIAAHDLWQHARGRRLTVAARRIFPDDTEQVFILRSAFWQYFAILPPDSIRPKVVRVRGGALLTGEWYFFVGCRRFERLYSTAAPSKPAIPRPAREQPPPNTKLTVLPDEPQFEPPAKWRPEQAEEWLKEIIIEHPRRPGESKNKWAKRLYNDHMKPDFGDAIPWDEGTVRRRMNPWKKNQAK